MTKKVPQYRAPALDKGLDILELMAERDSKPDRKKLVKLADQIRARG